MRQSLPNWGKIALAVLCLYALILVVLFFTQRSFIYHPPGQSIPPPSGFEEVHYQSSDGLALKAAWLPPVDGKPVVIFLALSQILLLARKRFFDIAD